MKNKPTCIYIDHFMSMNIIKFFTKDTKEDKIHINDFANDY